jgi:hypothetical protein
MLESDLNNRDSEPKSRESELSYSHDATISTVPSLSEELNNLLTVQYSGTRHVCVTLSDFFFTHFTIKRTQRMAFKKNA